LGNQTITLRGSDGLLSDAMALPLPIEAAGAAEHQRDAGSLPDQTSTNLLLPPGYESGVLHVQLLPSVVAQLIQNVRLLDVYPYYCTEQTMSAALPAVFIDRMLTRTGLKNDGNLKTGDIVKKAIARLVQLQHSDGSWGWWEADEAHPFMSAYALYGLAEFRKAGYLVPGGVLTNGIDSVVLQLGSSNTDTLRFWGGRQPNSEWNTRAFMLFALADAAPARVDRTLLAQTDAHVTELNSYALAVLGLAHHELGDDATARTLLKSLNARAIEEGAYTHWQGQSWHYAWEDDPIETTAYALRLEVALVPRSARIGHIVNFLRAQQHGSWWYTTKDTAAAVYAISQTVAPDSHEFNPDETVTVKLGDRILKTLRIQRPLLNGDDASISVSAADLHDGSRLSFERTGVGAFYWSTDWTRYAPPGTTHVSDAGMSILSRLLAKPSDFIISRTYTAPHRGAWRVGDEIAVDVKLRARSDTQYVAIEDPFPAGAEYQPLQGEAASDWSGLQFFDDRAVFFATRVSADYPLHLRYTLRVTTQGSYTAPPPTAYAMYGPPVSAVGAAAAITVAR
nr:hypothetical protein [Candidatus Eremiobacteraeota bacterium]